jgi:hypothetical protein
LSSFIVYWYACYSGALSIYYTFIFYSSHVDVTIVVLFLGFLFFWRNLMDFPSCLAWSIG